MIFVGGPPACEDHLRRRTVRLRRSFPYIRASPAAPKFLSPGGNPRNFGDVRLPNFFATARLRPSPSYCRPPPPPTIVLRTPLLTFELTSAAPPPSSTDRTPLPPLHRSAAAAPSTASPPPAARLCRRSTTPSPPRRPPHRRHRPLNRRRPLPPRPLHHAAGLSTATGRSTAAAPPSLSLSLVVAISRPNGFIGLSSSTSEDVLGRTASSAGRRPPPNFVVGLSFVVHDRSSSSAVRRPRTCVHVGVRGIYVCACGCEGYICVCMWV
uniref:Uncharacterized protein n=1 Tax=Oryza sativa subsp. japonica TaxID=39947 RepID=Q6Z9M6_ORYSJ|nr:hypothetical protein [Oryza sativa Japonica Group]